MPSTSLTSRPRSRRPRSSITIFWLTVPRSVSSSSERSSTTVTTRPRRFMTPRTAGGARGTRVKLPGGTTTSRTAESGSA